MRGPYPGELRIRVIHFVETGGSRREAAEQFQVSASSAIRWMQRFVTRARRRWIREQGWLDTTRLVFIDETAVTTAPMCTVVHSGARF